MPKLLYKERERTLLLNSNAIDEFPEIKKLMQDNPRIYDSEMDTIDMDIQIFFKENYETLINAVTSEWKVDYQRTYTVDLDDNMRCQLCHHKIKIVVVIVNKINNKELLIGKECAKHFGFVNTGEIRNINKIRRKHELSILYPEIDKKMGSWKHYINFPEILIPLKYETKFRDIINEFEKEVEGFIANNEKDDTIAKKLGELEDKIVREKDIIDEYIKNNKGDVFIPKKETLDWMSRNINKYRQQGLIWLKGEGRVTEKTIFRIDEPLFMKSIFDIVADKVRKCYAFALIGIRGNGYLLIHETGIRAYIPHYDLLVRIPEEVLGTVNSKRKETKEIIDLINEPSVRIDKDSYEESINQLLNPLRTLGYSIIETNTDFNEFTIAKGNKYFIVGNLSSFINKHKMEILGYEIVNVDELDKDIIDNSSAMDKKEYGDYQNRRANPYR